MEADKPRILVTDDSRVVRKAASSTLSVNYTVLEAASGAEALSILDRDDSVRALFLDLWMPGMDGFEVLTRIRQSENARLHDLPVIVITGDSEDETARDRALAAGASDFIGKPFSASQLFSSLSLLMQSAANEAADSESSMVPTTEIKAASRVRNPNASRLEQLVAGGRGLLRRCRESRQPLSMLKLRIERVGALYHKTGEAFAREVLREIGTKITYETRRKDMLVRLTVTDFVVVMPSTSAVEASEVAKRILRAVRHHVIEHRGNRFHLSMSGGVASLKLRPQTDFEDILQTATVRLERAIAAGGSQNIASDVDLDELRRDEQISLDASVDQLKKGDTAMVQKAIPDLLRKTFPLLVYANARLRLGIDGALKTIHEAIRH